jgi:hypothetical protein
MSFLFSGYESADHMAAAKARARAMKAALKPGGLLIKVVWML